MSVKSVIKEFKQFAVKGNVVDIAVGIIIGAAFGKIVASLVGDIIMPPLGILVGGVHFGDLALVLKEAVVDASGVVTEPAVVIGYGKFIENIIDFLIVAFAIFILVKGINRLKRKEEIAAVAPPAPPKPSNEELILTEIRDILKDK